MEWTEVRRGSKIHLSKPYEYIGFNGSRKLDVGNYFVCGFWADACGLSKTKEGFNDVVIPSRGLIYFDGINDCEVE